MTTSFFRIARRVAKASLFCAIFLCLSIVPFSVAAGQGSGGTGVAVIGPSPTSTPYACTSAGIQKAINDAINRLASPPPNPDITQSVVDASNCTTLTITSEIDVATGSTSTQSKIKFILPANGTWTATMTDGASYAFKWGNGVMIYGGTGSGEGQPFTIYAGGSSSLKAVCGNDPTIHGEYFHVEGFTCSAITGAKIQDAIIEISSDTTNPSFAGPADESYVGHVTAGTASSVNVPRVFWVHGACCSSTYEDINAEASSNTGGTVPTVPCVFGNGSNGEKNIGIHASKFSCLHPGKGGNAVQIQQTGGTSNTALGNSFRDFYMEESSAQDTGTAYVAVSEAGGTFPPADLLDAFRAGYGDPAGSTRYLVDIGAGSQVNISNLGLGYVSPHAIDDHVNGVTLIGTVNQTITSYDMAPRYRLALGALKVNSLPPASTNAGVMFSVSDSANTSEGQPCTAGGTQTALAFSNGSVWKCF